MKRKWCQNGLHTPNIFFTNSSPQNSNDTRN